MVIYWPPIVSDDQFGTSRAGANSSSRLGLPRQFGRTKFIDRLLVWGAAPLDILRLSVTLS